MRTPTLLWDTLQRVVASCGVVGVVGCSAIFWRILTSPGDEAVALEAGRNPVAMIALWGAGLSLVPASGLLGRRGLLWLGFSLPILALVVLLLGLMLR